MPRNATPEAARGWGGMGWRRRRAEQAPAAAGPGDRVAVVKESSGAGVRRPPGPPDLRLVAGPSTATARRCPGHRLSGGVAARDASWAKGVPQWIPTA